MTTMLFKLSLSIEAEALEAEIREKVEWALNEACSLLEGYLPKHETISYRIQDGYEI